MLEKKCLGNTGLEVSRIGLGGLFVSSGGGKRSESVEVIRQAWRLGINYIDTAPSYHDSESVIGEALRGFDHNYIVSTKLGNLPARDYRPRDPEFIRGEFEKSLRHLGLDRVDILYIHEPDRVGEFYDWWSDPVNYTGPVLDVLGEVRDAGKTGFIGLGGTTVTEMTNLIESGKFDVVLTAFQYSLLWQEARDTVIPAAAAHGMGIVCGSPLQQGALARIYRRDVIDAPLRWLSAARRQQFIRLYRLVEECGMPLPELALRFILSNPAVTTVLTGARSVAELESNVAAAERGALPEDILREIAEINAMVPYRPYQEPIGLPLRG